MKIAIVVHGRFYAFDLGRALVRCGHDVRVHTNYPKWAVRRFGLPTDNVRGFWIEGVLARVALRLARALPALNFEPFVHRLFGRWAARNICRERWDVVHSFSGVAEETFLDAARTATLLTLVRASAHIRTQDRLLHEEAQRTSLPVERPSAWMIAREEREYGLADVIVVVSRFVYESFLSEGVPAHKLVLLPLGVDTKAFRASEHDIQHRCDRIRARQPLRVLFVGTLSLQKGIYDLVRVVRCLRDKPFHFRAICDIPPQTRPLLGELEGCLELLPRRRESRLPEAYAWADLFLFPTIQDGYPAVLAQAHANALPVLTTPNCSAAEVVQNGVNGWILPIRQPEAFIERLEWCDAHRDDLAGMVRTIHQEYRPRDWDDVAREFEQVCAGLLAQKV